MKQEENFERELYALKSVGYMDRLRLEQRLEKTHALIEATRTEEDDELVKQQNRGSTAAQPIGSAARMLYSAVSRRGRKLLNKALSVHKLRIPDDGGGHVHFRLPSI